MKDATYSSVANIFFDEFLNRFLCVYICVGSFSFVSAIILQQILHAFIVPDPSIATLFN